MTATKPKRDPAVAPLFKRLETNRPGLGMAIDDLMLATCCKGLKSVSDPARTGMLDRLRLDDRFEVTETLGAPGGWYITLRTTGSADEDPVPGDEPAIDGQAQVQTKTIGEMVAEAEASGQPAKETDLAKPISRSVRDAEPGQRVHHDVFGDGAVMSNNGKTITVNFGAHGEKAMELDFCAGKMRFLSDVISNGPVPEAAKPLTEEEQHDLLFKAMQTHQEQGVKLAAEFFDLKRQEASQDGALKITRETIKELQKTMASHMAAVPTLESIAQKKIEFDVGTAGQAGQPVPDDWHYNVPADQVIPLDQIPGLTFDALTMKIRGELAYQSEVHQIGQEVIEVKGSRYLLRESSIDDRRWFAQPVLTKDEWQQLHEAEYGRPLKDFDQNDEAAATRKKGGEDCGRLVRVSRSLAVLGPESQGIVITVPDALLPAPPGAAPTGKDAAAGADAEEVA